MENKKNYKKAKKRVEVKIGFFIHLLVYLLVNTMLIAINLSTSSDHIWTAGPLLGWGIGLFFHGVGVFLFSGLTQVKEKMIQKELSKF
ncbi:MAG: 2TM domain-containing protein [Desulfobacula sp.]|jgi:hypothetical protein|nr:2TM domain-containing protein [Desulfobacula sp.]